MSLRPAWNAAMHLLADHRDVLTVRSVDGDVPEPLVTRGWGAFLASLSDDAVDTLEIHGHDAPWPVGAPASLLELSRRARSVASVDALAAADVPERKAERRETPRKRAQIDAFAHLVAPLVRGAARARRVVDVGAGHGHLTRELARCLGVPVLGLERDPHIARRARTLAPPGQSSPVFEVTDVLRDGLPFAPGDCVVGLHACGELGDAIVTGAADRAASLVLVGCCLQKRRETARRALSSGASGGAVADLPRDVLGLSNLSVGDVGVEASRADNLAARERRLALHRLLSAVAGPLRRGAEIEGMNRRAAHHDLGHLVTLAFARRGLAAPSRAAVEDAAAFAHARYALLRRFELPRAALARTIEVAVLLDRGLYLEERGFEVAIGAAFPRSVSARNLALVARRPTPEGRGAGGP